MCCLFTLAAMISPRLGVVVLWAFTDRMTIAFDHWYWGLIGFLFLPWTTIAWALAYAPVRGVTGFGWVVVGFAFFVDLATHFGSSQARRNREQAATA
jgi:hypothetical protein